MEMESPITWPRVPGVSERHVFTVHPRCGASRRPPSLWPSDAAPGGPAAPRLLVYLWMGDCAVFTFRCVRRELSQKTLYVALVSGVKPSHEAEARSEGRSARSTGSLGHPGEASWAGAEDPEALRLFVPVPGRLLRPPTLSFSTSQKGCDGVC